MFDILSHISVGLGFALFIMLPVWSWAVQKDFYSSVDVAWSYSFGALSLVYALQTPGAGAKTWLLCLMLVVWSLRLGTHLFLRLKSHFPTEDGRYVQLKKDWAKNVKFSFLAFFMAQGLSVALLSAPIMIVALSPDQSLGLIEYCATLVWLIAVCGEGLADHQLNAHKANPANRGKTCQTGLWRYSRHPNYFFEWMIWVSYFVFSLGSEMGLISIYCPLVMLYLLFKVTGIPATEAQSLRSRGDEYRRYQETTSVFVPWWPKK